MIMSDRRRIKRYKKKNPFLFLIQLKRISISLIIILLNSKSKIKHYNSGELKRNNLNSSYKIIISGNLIIHIYVLNVEKLLPKKLIAINIGKKFTPLNY